MGTLQIFNEWTTYEKVVARDYMHHRAFFASLQEQAESRFDRGLSIIDIGCGDARPVLTLLERLRIERYVGIDQSETALRRAFEALKETGIAYELRTGSMLDELRKLDGRFDLAICSYSLHHLNREHKGSVLSECRRLVQAHGLLAVIDVFLEAGESRSSFVDRWQNNARRKFTALAPEELEALLDHVRSSDVPETVSEYRRIGNSAGFDTVASISEDAERLNKLVIFF